MDVGQEGSEAFTLVRCLIYALQARHLPRLPRPLSAALTRLGQLSPSGQLELRPSNRIAYKGCYIDCSMQPLLSCH